MKTPESSGRLRNSAKKLGQVLGEKLDTLSGPVFEDKSKAARSAHARDGGWRKGDAKCHPRFALAPRSCVP